MNPRGLKLNPHAGPARALIFRLALACFALPLICSPATLADSLHLTNGTILEVDEVWEDGVGIWFRRGGVTQVIDKERVRRIERSAGGKAAGALKKEPTTSPKSAKESDKALPASAATQSAPPPQTVWLHLVGGAKMEVEEANETVEGVWFKRANLAIFIEKSRVERIERETLATAKETNVATRKGRAYGWTTGSNGLDALIRQNGARYGVDPYLIFCVMEHESQFRMRAVSPAGARGLMQLMPGTARRFGVRNVFDPAESVMGGTRYLKELLNMWGGRVDLALASYNAGEGAVMRYGKTVPPYRETRNYVKRIGARYGQGSAVDDAAAPAQAPPDTTP
jgi:soluble lytic murein transglycosylase-like protein